MNLTKMTLLEAKEALLNKKVSSVELTEECINKIKENKKLNAFVTETLDLAKEKAKESDKKIAEGKAGKLEGIPFAVKDLFCTKGIKTTSSSKMLENFIPPYESTVTSILDKEGYVMVGKTNMDEFAMGSSCETSYFQKTANPRNLDHVPGGSSGGSGAAVAAGEAVLSLGSDTGGSIRLPSAYCGVVGLKPTYSSVSRFGLVAFASSLDQIGPLGRSVEDVAMLYSAICGYDPMDATSAMKGSVFRLLASIFA